MIDFKYDGPGIGKGGTATMKVDGKDVAEGKLARTVPLRFSADETLDIGEDTGTPVSEDYHVPFKFTGTLEKVVLDLTPGTLGVEDRQKLEEGKAAIGVSE